MRRDSSPRHVPDRIYEVGGIPYTLTGKKMEVPVRKILMGWPLEKAASRDAMANPEAIDYFIEFARQATDYSWREPLRQVGERRRRTLCAVSYLTEIYGLSKEACRPIVKIPAPNHLCMLQPLVVLCPLTRGTLFVQIGS